MRHAPGLEASPGGAVYWEWKEGATKVGLDDAKAALWELEADDLVVQAKAPAGANSSATSGFAARVLGAKTPPAPLYHDADGIGDACEAPVVSDPILTDPAFTGASVQRANRTGHGSFGPQRIAAPALPLARPTCDKSHHKTW